MSSSSDSAVARPEVLRIAPITDAETYFREFRKAVDRLGYQLIEQAAATILRAYNEDRTVFLFGNGGSAALASHMACDLGKGTAVPGNAHRRIRVLALTDNIPLMTAWANDTQYDDIFAEQLHNLIQPGDIAFAISGSGNSPNVLNALKVARNVGAFTVGLTGYQGGRMKGLCDLCLIVPVDNMQIIEDLHLGVAHCLFTIVRNRILGDRQPQALAAAAR